MSPLDKERWHDLGDYGNEENGEGEWGGRRKSSKRKMGQKREERRKEIE